MNGERVVHPGPHDGSGPLAWILGSVCIAFVVLILKVGGYAGPTNQAVYYVVHGVAAEHRKGADAGALDRALEK